MRRLTAFAAAAMLAACTTAQADKENQAGSQPSASQTQAAPAQPAAAPASPPQAAAPAPSTEGTSGPSAEPAATPAGNAAPAAPAVGSPEADYREVRIPAGTILHVTLDTPVGSDTSRIEQSVRGTLRSAVVVRGVEVLPAGTPVLGHVTAARRPGRVKGRGYVAMRFTSVDTPGEGTTKIATAAVGHLAPATKEQDALKIIAPAAGGAVLGRVVGGKSGARKGAVVGGAAGTGYVLSTRGKEARLERGSRLAVRLTAPVTVRVKR